MTRRVPGGVLPTACKVWRKSVVSFKKDSPFGESSFMKKSTNWDILSVGQPLPEMIGLPGGGNFPLWILGSR